MKTKTILASVLCSGLLVASVNAAEVEYFVGAAAGYQTDKVDGGIQHDTEDMSWQGRVGVLIEQQHRITGTFGYMEDKFSQADSDYKQEQYSWLVSYDYLIPVHKDVNLFVGVTAGANDNKIAGRASTDVVWGGQAGVQYKWSEHFSSDLGYRYLEQDYERHGISIDNSQQVYLTLDYKF
ncbi:porin family protein [Shewanella benthica]|uniref:outer membrane beta-barrel protein n=1 Tax=Shewanella benthica TaxID=43661 RepID=UPI0018794096|nr:outer membrane beta-barrel protein [Shewanella benthica]MBE7215105.1 porin family protein [Shewanella benthica]MCL1062145.1 porin family protein [Shewanella benthica]